MNVQELVADLAEQGVRLSVSEGQIAYEAPQGILTPGLKAKLSEHKTQVLEVLTRQSSPPLTDVLPGGVVESQGSLIASDVCAMRLSDFAKAGLVVEVRSEVLGEVVVFASDNARVDPGERRVVYRASELREMLDLGPNSLRQVHRVKKPFRGTVRAN